MQDIDVRRLHRADETLAKECARLMVSSEPWVTLQRTFETALAALRDPGKETYVVLDGERVAAFAILDLRGVLSGYVQTICVRPDLRGRGVGTALLRWAEHRIHRDSPNVFLCVSSFNTAARRLYERLGYECVGRLPAFIVAEHDELLLRKTQGPWSDFRAAGRAVLKEEEP